MGTFLFEPKWDGFRAIVFRDGGRVHPEPRPQARSIATSPICNEVLAPRFPGAAWWTARLSSPPRGLDFDALQMRLHPAASRVAKLARETPPPLSPSTCLR